jgi:surface protein
MKYMFFRAYEFNQDISNWNVSNVKDMFGIFMRATKFNKNINNWNISNVIDLSRAFAFS